MEKHLPEDTQNEDTLGETPRGPKSSEAPDGSEAGVSEALPVQPDTRPSSTSVSLGDRSAVVHAQMEFSGPLPPPQILGQYDQVLPGAAERILQMAEKQQNHRIDMNRSGVQRANWGLGAGFSLSVLGLGLTAFLVLHGHDAAGSILGGTTFLSLVGTFVYGSKVKSQENIEKARLIAGYEDEDKISE